MSRASGAGGERAAALVKGRAQNGNCECYVMSRASGAGSERAAVLAGAQPDQPQARRVIL